LRRGLEEDIVEKALPKLGDEALRALLLELAVMAAAGDLVDYDGKVSGPILDACHALGVEPGDIEAEVKAEAKTAEKVRPKKRAKGEVAA
jgi:hypothetical protein